MSTTTAVILAAGGGTRMKSPRPKVLHEVCGRPMLWYVLQACYEAGCQRVIVVVGHSKDEVIAAFDQDRRIAWVEQAEQLGTGHAVRTTERELQKLHGDVFILAGDGPLIRAEVLRTLLRAHHEEHASASIATAIIDNPYGYGRIIRDDDGSFLRIVEELDCTDQQRQVREIYPSYCCVRSDDLLGALGKLTNANRKHEYYLTDVFQILRNGGRKVVAVQVVSAEDVLSINTRQQLAEVDALLQDRIQRDVRDAGVTIVSPINTYIEGGAAIGRDTTIHPFTFIGRDASIGPSCTLGPFAVVPRQSIVPENTVIAGNVSAETAVLKA